MNRIHSSYVNRDVINYMSSRVLPFLAFDWFKCVLFLVRYALIPLLLNSLSSPVLKLFFRVALKVEVSSTLKRFGRIEDDGFGRSSVQYQFYPPSGFVFFFLGSSDFTILAKKSTT